MQKNKLPPQLKDLLHYITFHPKERLAFYRAQTITARSQLLYRLSKRVQGDLIHKLETEEIARILEYLDPDQATDILQSTEKNKRNKIILLLSEKIKKDIEILLPFDPNTAGGIMNLNYIQVGDSELIFDIAEKYRAHEERTGKSPVIIVTKNGVFMGYIPGHQLVFSKPSDTAKKHVHSLLGVRHNASKQKVIEIFRTNPHDKVVVLNDQGGIRGVIYTDDVLRLMNEQESALLYDFAGVHAEETVTDGVQVKVSHRYKWLIINLGTAFLAAFTVGLFENTISKYVLLAVYMPIIAGMGGNAATQTLAILVRGIALKQITLQTAWPVLKRELLAGFINGAINGLIVAGIVLVFHRDIRLALVLGIAMVTNLLVAGFFGTLIPLIMKALGKDPATSATIFITTATDVLGFMVFLGLASLLLF